jgi:hypothetical protein
LLTSKKCCIFVIIFEKYYNPIKMDIKQKFIDFTSRTYPHGTEHLLFDKVPQNLEMDDFGNLFIKIGESDVMFTSHLDTATSAISEVNHVFDGNIIKTDGKSILGADDKAGVVVMLYMIEKNIPGLYYFFLGEEVGCVGSRKVSGVQSEEKLPYINKVISFDRRGTDSVITFQGGSRCASDEFAKALSEELNKHNVEFKYKPDPTGIYTDSAQFVKIYPECTNISVGYYSEHTYMERQDIDHLVKLAEACLKVDWISLPSKRDPSKTEWGGYGGYGYGDDYSYGYGWGGYDDGAYSRKSYSHPPKPATKKVFFYDKEFDYMSSFTINSNTIEVISIDLSKERVRREEADIYDLLVGIDFPFDDLSWDGMTLKITDQGNQLIPVKRNEIVEYMPELDLRKHIREVDNEEGGSHRVLETHGGSMIRIDI